MASVWPELQEAIAFFLTDTYPSQCGAYGKFPLRQLYENWNEWRIMGLFGNEITELVCFEEKGCLSFATHTISGNSSY